MHILGKWYEESCFLVSVRRIGQANEMRLIKDYSTYCVATFATHRCRHDTDPTAKSPIADSFLPSFFIGHTSRERHVNRRTRSALHLHRLIFVYVEQNRPHSRPSSPGKEPKHTLPSLIPRNRCRLPRAGIRGSSLLGRKSTEQV